MCGWRFRCKGLSCGSQFEGFRTEVGRLSREGPPSRPERKRALALGFNFRFCGLRDLDDFQYCINSFDYLEILVVVSASCPITGNSLESRHSYSKENLRYKSRLAPCVRVFDGAHEVDFEAFHQTVPLK